MAEKHIFDEWAEGVALANPSSTSEEEFFKEFEMNLEKPADFVVRPEDLPPNPAEVTPPVSVTPPVPVEPPVPEVNSETRKGKKGGSITLEKTSRGWRATLDVGEPGINPENFYANNKDDLIFAISESKFEAIRGIRRLKKEKFLGGDEPISVTPPPISKPLPTLTELSADDIAELKNKLADNPAEGFDSYVKKRFGIDPEQFAEALKSAPQAQAILESQRLASEVKEVNEDFTRENPDFTEQYAPDSSETSNNNIRKLVARMSKAYLPNNKRITLNTPQPIVDLAITELYKKGYWTVQNLEKAKEELIDIGELYKLSESHPVSQPEPQQVVTPPSTPSVPVQPRIAEPTGQPVSLGLPVRGSTSTVIPEEKLPSAEDLQNMSMADLRRLAQLQIFASKQGRQ